MKKAGLVLSYYRGFCAAGISVSLVCAYICFKAAGNYISPAGLSSLISGFSLVKLLSTAAILYINNSVRNKEYFYYKNLGISKYRLWSLSALIDITIFIAAITLAIITA